MSVALEQHIKKAIDIPTYFLRFVDNKINLVDTPSICCPFHDEDTPSFSYSHDKGVWSCFGSCKAGGDVINMHKKNRGLRTREEAINSLARELNIDRRTLGFVAPDYDDYRNKTVAKYKSKLIIASNKAKTVEQWLELDYLVSFNKPYDEMIEDLDDFINRSSSRAP